MPTYRLEKGTEGWIQDMKEVDCGAAGNLGSMEGSNTIEGSVRLGSWRHGTSVGATGMV